MRVRTLRRARAIGKTGKAIVKSSAADIQQMRCPRCSQLALPTRTPDGTQAYQCSACGAMFTCKPL